MRHHRQISATLICLCVLLSACKEDPRAVAQRRLAAGDALLEKRQFSEAIHEYRAALTSDPALAMARLKLARAYVATGSYANAFPEYMRVGDLLPDDLNVQAEVGNILLLARQFEEAKARARAILEKDPSHLGGLVLLGNALAGLQDLENAVSVAERAVTRDSQRAGGYMNLGALRLARGDHRQAEEAFLRAVALNPKSVAARISLANFYRAVGRLQDSERQYRQAVDLEPANYQSNRAIASFYVATNLRSRAEPYLRRIAETVNDPNSWLELADVLVEDGKTAEALGVLQKISANEAMAKIRIARITHASGRTDEAHKILAELLAKQPNNAEALALDADLLLVERRVDDALARAHAARQANPNSPEAQFVLGKVYVARHELEPARLRFNEVINLDPGTLEARLELSRLHLERREIDTAIQVAREAVRVHPNDISARLAVVHSLLARPEDHPAARREAEDLVRAFPWSPAARAALGDFYLSLIHI